MDDEVEIPLAGGNVNEAVVRVGQTVRRVQGPHSPTVHALLRHLRQVGFNQAPEFLGIDDKSREILSFLDGDTSPPKGFETDDTVLDDAIAMLRRYHQATLSFVAPEGAQWGYVDPDETRHEVICHNDFAPYNMVFRSGRPIGVYDFDVAGPGPRLRDLAYLAYWLVPLSFSTEDLGPATKADLENGSPRLKRACAIYGVPANGDILDMVSAVMELMSDADRIKAIVGPDAARRLQKDGHLDHWAREAQAFSQAKPRLAANLAA